MKKFIFLDRDGVICEDIDLLHKKEQIKLIHRAAEAIKLLNENNYSVIIITNQPVIARGLCTLEQLNDIHKHMINLLAEQGAHIDSIYFCPHHPAKGNNPVYTRECDCRKPKPGLILQAQRDFNILTLSEYYMIGDSISDIRAGRDSGCKTILVGSKIEPFKDAVPDFKAKDLYEAVANIILGEKQ